MMRMTRKKKKMKSTKKAIKMRIIKKRIKAIQRVEAKHQAIMIIYSTLIRWAKI